MKVMMMQAKVIMMIMKMKVLLLQKSGARRANQQRLAHVEVRGTDCAGTDAVCRVSHEHLAGFLLGCCLHAGHHGHQTHQQPVRAESTLISVYYFLKESIL